MDIFEDFIKDEYAGFNAGFPDSDSEDGERGPPDAGASGTSGQVGSAGSAPTPQSTETEGAAAAASSADVTPMEVAPAAVEPPEAEDAAPVTSTVTKSSTEIISTVEIPPRPSTAEEAGIC